MDHPRIDPEGAQRPHPAHAQHHVLRQAGDGIGLVETGGDPALHRTVARYVGVQQKERYPADVHTPDVSRDLGVVDRDSDRHWRSVGVVHADCRQPLRIGVDPVFMLPAAAVDPLAEVALAIHEPDGDHRDRAVRRLLEEVASQYAQASGVHRKRDMYPVLRA